MGTYTELIDLARCRRGAGTFVEAGGRELAVFLPADSDEVFVLDNACPHAGGNLSGGTVAGLTVRCPWHDWTFDLRTGVCTHSPLAAVKRYPTLVRDGAVFALIE